MKLIDGTKYYTTTDVSIYCGKTAQSVILWDKYSDKLEEEGQKRLIPKPIRLGDCTIRTNFKHLDEQKEMKTGGKRMWSETQLNEIVEFSNNLKRGDLAEFSRERWGKRGDEIKERLNKKEFEQNIENAKKMEDERLKNRLKNM